MVKFVVEKELMPPWFAADDATGNEDFDLPVQKWANDGSLSSQEKQDLLAWLASDKPAGDELDAPLPREYPAQWMIGEPDWQRSIPRAIEIKATGQMPYVNLRVDPEFTEGKWIKAVEIQPTAREAVHHVLVFVVKPGERTRIDETSGFLAAYVPGNSYQIYPEDHAKYVPAGAQLIFQMHYTPIGKKMVDQTELGLKFADGPPKHVVRNVGIANTKHPHSGWRK